MAEPPGDAGQMAIGVGLFLFPAVVRITLLSEQTIVISGLFGTLLLGLKTTLSQLWFWGRRLRPPYLILLTEVVQAS